MVSPLKRVMSEYVTLIHKMAEDVKDATSPHVTKSNFNLLVDIFVPIALLCFQHLLERIHYLAKFLQQRDILICDYLATIIVCQGVLILKYAFGRMLSVT
jgi:hypothetical protein